VLTGVGVEIVMSEPLRFHLNDEIIAESSHKLGVLGVVCFELPFFLDDEVAFVWESCSLRLLAS
jgi:hypothetical protein